MSSIKQQLTDDMKAAMRAKEKDRLGTIRLLLAAIKQKEIDTRVEQSDEQVLAILVKQSKQRKESIRQYQQAGRDDLIVQEQLELDIISHYLPSPMSEADIEAHVTAAIAEVNATSMKDMQKIMSVIADKMNGRADMAFVSALIKAKLT